MIKYDYKEIRNNKTPSLSTQIDYSKVKIPKEIISKLKESVEICNLTGIENILEDLEWKNGDEKAFSKTLNGFLRSYDTGRMIQLIENLEKAYCS